MKKLLISALLLCSIQPAFSDVTIYAAASTTDAINDIGKLVEQETGIKVKSSFASSSTLAKQIANGAPASVFISASPKWMDFVEEKQRLTDGSRMDLLKNEVVVIAPQNSSTEITMEKGFDFAGAFDGRLCMGDPQHVPAGMYGKTALESLGWWSSVEKRVVGTADVRAALSFVERGECPLGIVYATDAAISKQARIIATFPAETHDPVVYPVALIKGAGETEEAQKVIDFLFSPEAESIFAEYGFKTIKH